MTKAAYDPDGDGEVSSAVAWIMPGPRYCDQGESTADAVAMGQ